MATMLDGTQPMSQSSSSAISPASCGATNSAMGVSHEIPFMDWSQLHESLTAVSPDLTEALELLRGTYLEDAQILVGRLQQAVESLDFEQLRFTAHTLKSSSALMGAATLSEVCRQIEIKARQQDPDGLSGLAAHAQAAQKQVTEILLAYSPDEI